jgi:Uma2 family endonuclease
MSADIYSPDLDESIEYPDSDGEPLSDNSLQLDWIILIKSELDSIFDYDNNVAVHGDLLWYPVQGHPEIRRAPDTMVIIGRPKGYRGSYRQWRENHVAPQVTFEILSPSNTDAEMLEKRLWYERYGVEEYYEYDPELYKLRGWRQIGSNLHEITQMNGWVSPRLKIRFEQDSKGELTIYRPDGQPFRTHKEVYDLARMESLRALSEQRRADEERQRAEDASRKILQEHLRANQERQRAEQERERAEQAQLKADQEREKAEKLAAKLRELGINPDQL